MGRECPWRVREEEHYPVKKKMQIPILKVRKNASLRET